MGLANITPVCYNYSRHLGGDHMARIPKTEENTFPIPSGASVTRGYVYLNTSSYWAKSNGRLIPNHDKLAIGKTVVGKGGDWKSDRRMYANKNFHEIRHAIESKSESKTEEEVKRDNSPHEADSNKNPRSNESLQKKAESKISKILKSNSSSQDQEVRCASGLSSMSLQRDGSINIGLHLTVKRLAETSGLKEALDEVFEPTITSKILDLAQYVLDTKRAVYQHYASYARDNAIFSDTICSDGNIGKTLKEHLTLSKINHFKNVWAQKVLKDPGEPYACYDSTNVNSQCRNGVGLVQKGHAKDDPSLPQVNIDYVVRQQDGLPITFSTFPGSIPDITEATDMFDFFKNVIKDCVQISDKCKNGKDFSDEEINKIVKKIMFICDRGYISKDNIKALDNAFLDFLLLIRGDMNISKEMIDKHYQAVRSRRNEIERGVNGMTVTGALFEGDARTRYFHIIYNEKLRPAHETDVRNKISQYSKEIEKHIAEKTVFTNKALDKYKQYYVLNTEKVISSEKPECEQKSTKKSGKEDEGKYIITGFEEDYDKTDIALAKCGFMVLVSSKELTASEALEIYRKRDCVEKNFMTMKSFLGMTCFRSHSPEAMYAKSLIWFVASILHALMFNSLEDLKAKSKNKKRYTVPAVIENLRHAKTIVDMTTGQYKYFNRMSKFDRDLFKCFGISENEVYEFARTFSTCIESDYDAIIDTQFDD